MPPPAHSRNMTVWDTLLLVGSAAVGLGAFQWVHRSMFPGWIWLLDRRLPELDEISAERVMITVSDLMSMLIAIVGPWTVLLLVLRMRSPATPWRRIWRQPGMAACLAVIIAWFWSGLALLIVVAMDHTGPGRIRPSAMGWAQSYLANELFMYVGLAVAVTWLVQALSGRWRRPVDWIDRTGRVVGAAWILIGFVWTMREYLGFLA